MMPDGPTVTIPLADYERLLELVELDDMLCICSLCGAWIDREDPACATTDDFTGCWKIATGRPQDEHLCRSYRAAVLEQPPPPTPRTCLIDGCTTPPHGEGQICRPHFFKLPIPLRQRWWKETDYSRQPASEELRQTLNDVIAKAEGTSR